MKSIRQMLSGPGGTVSQPASPEKTSGLNDGDFRRIVEALPLGVTIKDADGRILYCNPAEAALHGYTPEELIGQYARTLGVRQARQTISAEADPQVAAWQRGSWNVRRGGETFPVHLRSSVVHDEAGDVLGIVTTCQDLAEQDRVAGQIGKRALEDPLTGLANRTFFVELVNRAIKRLERHSDYRFAVLFLNLHRFRLINDSFGHDSGDVVLVTAARHLQESIRPTDVAARVAGDEFAILLDGLAGLTDATRVAERVMARFSSPQTIQGREVYVTPRIGIAVSQGPRQDAEEYLRDAGLAMHRAKAEQSAFEVFDPVIHQRAVERLTLESDLRKGIQQEQLRVLYQPIVDLKSRRVVGFEALVRWMHPQRGLILPADFIAVAEDTGLIVPIGTWMLQAACSQLVTWLARFPERTDLSMNVNMSVRHLRQPNIVDQVLHTLRETGLPAERLKLEVTESMLMENAVTQVDVLHRLRAIGVGVAIDDFGTGYSSLSYLQRFPIDALKIDRSFIAHDTRSDNWEIVRMILALARDKRALTVAEGVETEDQARDLRNLGCDRAQGYLFGRPLEADAAEQMLGG